MKNNELKMTGNEPAFPIPDETPGLTKREYFAAMALQGLLAKYGESSEYSTVAVTQADSIIKELNKRLNTNE